MGELHARPFFPAETPRRFLHVAFLTSPAEAQAERAMVTELCHSRGVPGPAPGAKYHRVSFGGATLRWESHAEFSTYTWDMPSGEAVPGQLPFHPAAALLASPLTQLPQPGPLLVAVDLDLVMDTMEDAQIGGVFDRASLARSDVNDGRAEIATDFKPDPAGFVRILVRDRALGAEAAGALVQRVLEIETYRTLALLGLPEAQKLAPTISKIEARLAQVTEEMTRSVGLSDNHRLLDELVALAAELEADTAPSLFRFGASRAYQEIVRLRLATIQEEAVQGYPTWQQFLDRRMAPAMRTCQSVEERQGNIAAKLVRGADLLRTRVDVELERQNRDLLASMNDRTRLQLRLQRTVEGLSVAAISYYVASLIHLMAEGIHESGVDAKFGVHINPGAVTAVAVPVAVLAVWWVVRRVRSAHGEHD
ncbi:membrane protein [Azorhizobium oxalatiphilum]|uniref:Membrane protein n=2 Tax=Azorhizobium oxalatiphilum TaxID=980631 RepID=A0A917BJW6_9HYPH|nr:membrane protein [Azorhizobium oxalatiphilum]